MTPLRAQGVSTRVCSGESLGGRNEAWALLGDGRPRTQGPRKVLSSPKGFLESLGSSASAASEPPKDYGKPLGGRSRPPSRPPRGTYPARGGRRTCAAPPLFPPRFFIGENTKGGSERRCRRSPDPPSEKAPGDVALGCAPFRAVRHVDGAAKRAFPRPRTAALRSQGLSSRIARAVHGSSCGAASNLPRTAEGPWEGEVPWAGGGGACRWRMTNERGPRPYDDGHQSVATPRAASMKTSALMPRQHADVARIVCGCAGPGDRRAPGADHRPSAPHRRSPSLVRPAPPMAMPTAAWASPAHR